MGLPGMGAVKQATTGLSEWLSSRLASKGANALSGAPRMAANVAKVAVPVAEDASIAASMAPENERGSSAKKAAATSLGMRGVGGVANKTADYLAQKAAGIRNTKAGLGNKILDQRIWGTKGMQSNQVQRKIGEGSLDLDAAVNSITDPISAKNVVDTLRSEAAKLEINGQVPANQLSAHKQYSDLADSIEKMGSGENVAFASEDLHRLKQSQGDVAHNARTGLVPDTDKANAANIAKKESRQALSDAYASQFPDQINQYETQNDKLATLFGAQRGLKNKTGLNDLVEAGILGGIGYSMGGTEGAVKGALLKAPAVRSGGAYLSRGIDKTATGLASPLSRNLFKKENK
jgi:hypothetical protein